MVILFVGLLLIVHSIFSQKYNVAWGMFFVLLIMGFQEGIPGDFMSYKYLFLYGGPDDVYGSTIKETEYSYIWLVKICSQFMNFNVFVFITALVQCFAMGVMIKEHADNRYWGFGIMLIFFTYNLMLMQMKAMRQGYSVDCLLLAYWLLGRRRYLISLLLALAAYGFHNASIIAMPFFVGFYVVMLFQHKKLKLEEASTDAVEVQKGSSRFAVFVAGGLLLFTILKFTVIDDFVRPFATSLDFFEYEGYLDLVEERGLSWWIVLYNTVATFASGLYFKSEKNTYKKFMALLSLLSSYVYVGFFGLGALFRVSMFFDIFSIVTYPNVAGMLRNTYGKNLAMYYILFNLAYLMYFSIPHMVSMNADNGFGYGMFRFSFM